MRKLKPDGGGAILCFVGPPGVGKTSLGKSIAEAMGRKFIRVALGGVRDEADIRGHRRTYIGSMPGRIIAELRKAGTQQPGDDARRDRQARRRFPRRSRRRPCSKCSTRRRTTPSPTTTSTCRSICRKVLFIATANTMDTVPGPLRDRMEVIEIPGYTESDKLNIAKRYLVPRQLEANGLTAKQVKFQRRGAAAGSSRATPARPACAIWSGSIGAVCRGDRRGGRRRARPRR